MSSTRNKIAKQWCSCDELLEEGWNAVPSYFLANYHRLPPQPNTDGLSSSEALLLVHLLDYKWDENDPHPSVRTLAKRMGKSERWIRDILKDLEDLGYIDRQHQNGGTTRYSLDGLFKALVELYRTDQSKGGSQ
jgi:hypothetical protein